MPELPEVQTIVNDLNQKIVGKVFRDFWSEWPRGIRIAIDKMQSCLKNARVLKARRIGKHIIIDLDNHNSLIIHLKMTGHLLYKDKLSGQKYQSFLSERVNQYIRHIFYFTDSSSLEFSDLRKFGWIDLMPTKEITDLKIIQNLGVDAMDNNLNFQIFNDLLNQKPRAKIGTFLLNQTIISGIGNIYRSEILFKAGVNPSEILKNLKPLKRKKIFTSIKKILTLALEHRGTSDSDYRDTTGQKGNFQNLLKIYGRANQPCKSCNTPIKREKLGQRSVFWCPKCQKISNFI